MRQPRTISHAMPGHLIRRLQQLSSRAFADGMRAHDQDLTPIQFAALAALADQEGIDQAGLAAAIAIDRATLGAVVERLEQKGLVTRTVSGRDRRARQLELSEAGRQLLAIVTPVVTQLQDNILALLEPGEREVFVRLASKAVGLGDNADHQELNGS